MNYISIEQALQIQSHLWQAYYGDHTYGSHVAEIYYYHAMPYRPALNTNEKLWAKTTHKAEIAILGIARDFAREHNARVVVLSLQGHRMHVRVQPMPDDEGDGYGMFIHNEES